MAEQILLPLTPKEKENPLKKIVKEGFPEGSPCPWRGQLPCVTWKSQNVAKTLKMGMEFLKQRGEILPSLIPVKTHTKKEIAQQQIEHGRESLSPVLLSNKTRNLLKNYTQERSIFLRNNKLLPQLITEKKKEAILRQYNLLLTQYNRVQHTFELYWWRTFITDEILPIKSNNNIDVFTRVSMEAQMITDYYSLYSATQQVLLFLNPQYQDPHRDLEDTIKKYFLGTKEDWDATEDPVTKFEEEAKINNQTKGFAFLLQAYNELKEKEYDHSYPYYWCLNQLGFLRNLLVYHIVSITLNQAQNCLGTVLKSQVTSNINDDEEKNYFKKEYDFLLHLRIAQESTELPLAHGVIALTSEEKLSPFDQSGQIKGYLRQHTGEFVPVPTFGKIPGVIQLDVVNQENPQVITDILNGVGGVPLGGNAGEDYTTVMENDEISLISTPPKGQIPLGFGIVFSSFDEKKSPALFENILKAVMSNPMKFCSITVTSKSCPPKRFTWDPNSKATNDREFVAIVTGYNGNATNISYDNLIAIQNDPNELKSVQGKIANVSGNQRKLFTEQLIRLGLFLSALIVYGDQNKSNVVIKSFVESLMELLLPSATLTSAVTTEYKIGQYDSKSLPNGNADYSAENNLLVFNQGKYRYPNNPKEEKKKKIESSFKEKTIALWIEKDPLEKKELKQTGGGSIREGKALTMSKNVSTGLITTPDSKEWQENSVGKQWKYYTKYYDVGGAGKCYFNSIIVAEEWNKKATASPSPSTAPTSSSDNKDQEALRKKLVTVLDGRRYLEAWREVKIAGQNPFDFLPNTKSKADAKSGLTTNQIDWSNFVKDGKIEEKKEDIGLATWRLIHTIGLLYPILIAWPSLSLKENIGGSEPQFMYKSTKPNPTDVGWKNLDQLRGSIPWNKDYQAKKGIFLSLTDLAKEKPGIYLRVAMGRILYLANVLSLILLHGTDTKNVYSLGKEIWLPGSITGSSPVTMNDLGDHSVPKYTTGGTEVVGEILWIKFPKVYWGGKAVMNLARNIPSWFQEKLAFSIFNTQDPYQLDTLSSRTPVDIYILFMTRLNGELEKEKITKIMTKGNDSLQMILDNKFNQTKLSTIRGISIKNYCNRIRTESQIFTLRGTGGHFTLMGFDNTKYINSSTSNNIIVSYSLDQMNPFIRFLLLGTNLYHFHKPDKEHAQYSIDLKTDFLPFPQVKLKKWNLTYTLGKIQKGGRKQLNPLDYLYRALIGSSMTSKKLYQKGGVVSSHFQLLAKAVWQNVDKCGSGKEQYWRRFIQNMTEQAFVKKGNYVKLFKIFLHFVDSSQPEEKTLTGQDISTTVQEINNLFFSKICKPKEIKKTPETKETKETKEITRGEKVQLSSGKEDESNLELKQELQELKSIAAEQKEIDRSRGHLLHMYNSFHPQMSVPVTTGVVGSMAGELLRQEKRLKFMIGRTLTNGAKLAAMEKAYLEERPHHLSEKTFLLQELNQIDETSKKIAILFQQLFSKRKELSHLPVQLDQTVLQKTQKGGVTEKKKLKKRSLALCH